MNKPKRDITLGEMQDECGLRAECSRPDQCKYYSVCAFENHVSPARVILTDTPRFSDEAMGNIKAWYAVGIRSITKAGTEEFASLRGENGRVLGTIYKSELQKEIASQIPLDLAELLEKDGEK